MSTRPPKPQKRWTRSYPPLALLGVAVLVAVVILPSSLNLPQSNPSTVLEYAPVPPEDDEPPPPADGNLSSLGLGSSNTLAAPVAPPPLPPPLEGVGGRPNQKRCVGNPPRQTEDPTSPPCVPFFEGDNFGATYQGVNKDEIKVLAYFDQAAYGDEPSPAGGTYVDMSQPRRPPCEETYPARPAFAIDPNRCDHVITRVLKSYQRYFNTRFQTYGRKVHYYAYFTTASTAAGRRGDAVANWEKLKPFAVINWAIFNGFGAEYEEAMNKLGVLSFSSTKGSVPNAFYRRNAPLSWGFYPDVEHWAQMYSSYVCQKVVPYKVRRFGNPSGQGAPNGEKRRFGLWYTTDPQRPDLQLFAELVRAQIVKCGANVVDERTFSSTGAAVNTQDTGTEATQAVASFSSRDVTTVLYMGGEEARFGTSADAARYYPEIVIAGDLFVDNNSSAKLQNQNVWKNAFGQTFALRVNRPEDSPGFRAYKEGDPEGDDNGVFVARNIYPDHFMLFQAIQVAGPKLTPEAIDEGFHAIPEKGSVDPYIAAFFFDPGDYTSVKDAAEQWWDPNGRATGSGAQPGCWRMTHQGKRSLIGKWMGGDDVFKNRSDPCTGFTGGTRIK
jgi:hypothetical protein